MKKIVLLAISVLFLSLFSMNLVKPSIEATSSNEHILVIDEDKKYVYFGWYGASQMPPTGWELLQRTIDWANTYRIPNQTDVVLFTYNGDVEPPVDDSEEDGYAVYLWLVDQEYNVTVHGQADSETLPSTYYGNYNLAIYWHSGYIRDATNIVDSGIPFITVASYHTDEMGIGTGAKTMHEVRDRFYIVNNDYYPTQGHPQGVLEFESSMWTDATEAANNGIVLVQSEPTEPPATDWNQTYGGIADDRYPHSVVQTGDDGYAIAGRTNSFGAGDDDFWLVKTDSSGTMEWNQTYGGPNYDVAYSMIQTNDGGYAIAGHTRSFGAGGGDFWLVKTDSSGTMEWNQTYGGPASEDADSVVQTGDGGYAIAGHTRSFGAGDSDFWLVKTDSSGNMEWNQTYGGRRFDSAYSVVQTGDDGYAIAGVTVSFGAGDFDFWLVKTDSSGNMEWNQTYGGTDIDSAFSAVQTSDSGYAITGYTKSFGAGDDDFWLVKTDSSGNMEWNQTYGGTRDEHAQSVVQTGGDGYTLAGVTVSFGAGSCDFWLVKTDSSGNMEWNQTYGGPDDDLAYSVVHTNDGGYAIAGHTNSFGAGNYDFWLVKVAGALPVHNIDTGLDYATIQEAIDAPETLDGHSIHVDAGTYTEHITLHKSLSLVGEDRTKPHVTIIDGNGTGTVVEVAADEVNITGFTIQNSGSSPHSGIYVGDGSTSTHISYNSLTNNAYGIWLFNSTNNVMVDNTITENTYGVILENSGNNTLIDNRIRRNEQDFGVYGETLSDFVQDIDASNMVSAGEIRYLLNQKDLIVDPWAWPYWPVSVGYFAAVNSTNITIRNMILERNVQGVLLAYTHSSLIENVETTNNFAGIWLHHSANNTVTENIIADNMEGIHITNSSDNTIHHNNFINNTDQAKPSESQNTWDDGYPSGGNHWSDHKGIDEKNGPNQDQPGTDGIVDAPYAIDESNQDMYPLKDPWFNIAVVNISLSKTATNDTIMYIASIIQIPPGFKTPVEINVYCNSTLIANKTTIVGDYVFPFTLIFPVRLNTTLLPKGSHLTSVNVSTVSNEIYTVDNTYVGETFHEVFLGDINHDGIGNILDISTVGWAYFAWTIREDVNRDGIVNLIDVFIVSSAFGSVPGVPTWNPDADINEDGQVNINDPSKLSLEFGWTATTTWNQNVDWNNDLVINVLDLSVAAIIFGRSDL